MRIAGQYEQKTAIDLSKGVTMISRRANGIANEMAKVPGPGAYNPSGKNKKSNPAFKYNLFFENYFWITL